MKEIKISKGMIALVDDEDYQRINQFKWCASLGGRGNNYYAKRRNLDRNGRWKSQQVSMHHMVFDISPQEMPPGHVIDHDNGNGLDCRKVIDGRIQLEIVTAEVNLQRAHIKRRARLESEISL